MKYKRSREDCKEVLFISSNYVLQSMIYVEALHRIIFQQLHLIGTDNKAVSPVQQCRRQCATAAPLQQEFILPFGTILSQALMEASFQQTNRPTVLQCLYTNWGCCKFRDK